MGADLLANYPVTDLRSGITVRRARMSDVGWMARKIAHLDEMEVVLTDSDLTAFSALVISYENSLFCWSAVREQRTLGMFGVGIENVSANIGNPWFLMTPELYSCPKPMLKLAPDYVRLMQSHFRLLRGAVLDAHEPGKRFLRWLGFHLGPPFRAPATGATFRVYSREEVN